MFNSMKNKIREKTGTELPKFSPNSTSLFSKTKSNQHSRQSSQGSINSILSDHSIKEEDDTKSQNSNNTKNITMENTTKTLNIDWESKLIEKEKDWRQKEKTYVADLLKQTKELQDTLLLVEENRKKFLHCQEEKEQLEIYQKEEITKIKQLLLEKEEENKTNLTHLKDALSSIESLKQELNRLKPMEEQINNCQDDLECLRHTSEKERWNLSSQLAQKEEIIRHLEERISVLTHRTEADCQALGAQLSIDERVRSLLAERALLERRLEEAHIHLSEIKSSWSNKIAILETQVGRLSRQAGEEGVERRNAEKKILELEQKLELSVENKEDLEMKLEKLIKERDNLALELKHMSTDTDLKLAEDDETDTLTKLNNRLEVLLKENEALKQSGEESRKKLDDSLLKEIAKNSKLNVDIVKLKDYSQELAAYLEEEKRIKDETLLRNAEMSQKVQLIEQELKQQQTQNEDLFKNITILEEKLDNSQQTLEKLKSEPTTLCNKNLSDKIKLLEDEVSDKNKLIRVLQQNLIDVKKTFQNELKNNASSSINNNNNENNYICNSVDDDINFKYMKHVLIKFLTSSEYEAQQLTKAVATLLKLNCEEERMIKETLEWRSSWFGSKPKIKSPNNPS